MRRFAGAAELLEALGEQIGLVAIAGAHMHICLINSVVGRDVVEQLTARYDA